MSLLPENINTPILQWLKKLVNADKKAFFIFILVIMALYLLSSVNNLSDTDDVYAFAYRAENFAFSHVSDPRLMLYHMLSRAIYLTVNALLNPLGIEVSALVSMRSLSAFCAALSLFLMLRILVHNFQLALPSALMGAAFLGVSYGFWRYAAEAEVYIPATFFCLLIFHLMQKAQLQNTLCFILLGMLAGLTVLFYQPAVIPLFMAFPLLVFRRQTYSIMIVYGVSGVAVTIAGYVWGYHLYWPEPIGLESFQGFLSQRKEEFFILPLSIWNLFVSIARSGFSLMHDFSSTNYVFALSPVTSFIGQLFPHHIITEEKYVAQHFSSLAYLLLLSHLCLGIMVVWLLGLSIKWVKQVRLTRPIVTVLVWVLINGAIIGRLNPSGLEAWIMVFPPLFLLITVGLIQPALQHKAWLIKSLLALLFVHNAVGGMYLMHDDAIEYQKVKGKWVIEHGEENDLVIILDDANLEEPLRYLTNAMVINTRRTRQPAIGDALYSGDLSALDALTSGRDFRNLDIAPLIENTWSRQGRVIVFGEFFMPSIFQVHDIPYELKNVSEKVYSPLGMTATFVVVEPSKRTNSAE